MGEEGGLWCVSLCCFRELGNQFIGIFARFDSQEHRRRSGWRLWIDWWIGNANNHDVILALFHNRHFRRQHNVEQDVTKWSVGSYHQLRLIVVYLLEMQHSHSLVRERAILFVKQFTPKQEIIKSVQIRELQWKSFLLDGIKCVIFFDLFDFYNWGLIFIIVTCSAFFISFFVLFWCCNRFSTAIENTIQFQYWING